MNIKTNWEKSDFDNNGLTDILITGNTSEGPQTICVLDMGDRFELKKISQGELYEACSFPAIVESNKIVYYRNKIQGRYGSLFTKETLIYRNGEFIENNDILKKHHILEIKLRCSGGYGPNDDLDVEIISNRDMMYTITGRDRTTYYNSKLSQEKFKEVIDLLNYIDFENLADEYEVGYSDASTNRLEITYDNMKVKKISDYGGMGTRGLRQFYDLLFSLK
ncbi:DUF6438 domain-containing protein [Chryseobacterium sp.]|uniref:DUF6438 domain-containing protein n=1 Tax=Chryseobacterium sp. TaxID=1871047 RepID=UPI0025C71914|nr:DUF6438 domain-containing protein [Chryseobacterium sp.]